MPSQRDRQRVERQMPQPKECAQHDKQRRQKGPFERVQGGLGTVLLPTPFNTHRRVQGSQARTLEACSSVALGHAKACTLLYRSSIAAETELAASASGIQADADSVHEQGCDNRLLCACLVTSCTFRNRCDKFVLPWNLKSGRRSQVSSV